MDVLCRELNYFASFTMSDVNDPRSFSFVPAFAIVDAVLNIPCYLSVAVAWGLTYTPIRTYANSSRRVGPKAIV